jgi:hypothetical protein
MLVKKIGREQATIDERTRQIRRRRQEENIEFQKINVETRRKNKRT